MDLQKVLHEHITYTNTIKHLIAQMEYAIAYIRCTTSAHHLNTYNTFIFKIRQPNCLILYNTSRTVNVFLCVIIIYMVCLKSKCTDFPMYELVT